MDKTTGNYNIAPFMKFWDVFSGSLDKALKEGIDVHSMLNEKSEGSAGDRTDQGS